MPPMMTADPNAGLGKAGPSGVHTAAAASSSAPHEPAPAATRTNNNTINNTTDRDVGRDGGECKAKPKKKIRSGGTARVNRKGGMRAEKLKSEKCLKCG